MSNLSFISKIVEKHVTDQFEEHCNINDLSPQHQLAYKKDHSCETALVKIVNDALWAMEKGTITLLVITDLSPAFDSVNHSVLFSILEDHFAVSGAALGWFRSYLAGRGFKVNICEEYSSVKFLTIDVPQGSIRGPSLFNAYASTLNVVVPLDIGLNGFADDHSLQVKDDEHITVENVRKCIEDIDNWICRNCLRMNAKKTEVMFIGSKQQLGKGSTSSLAILDSTVKCEKLLKYLGLWLDDQLKFDHHATVKCKTAMWNIHKIRMIRPYLDWQTCEILVSSLATSHLDCRIALLAGVTDAVIKKYQKVQNIAARLILNIGSRDSAIEARKKLYWLPIQSRIKYKIALLVFKCLMGNAPIYLHNLLCITTD